MSWIWPTSHSFLTLHIDYLGLVDILQYWFIFIFSLTVLDTSPEQYKSVCSTTFCKVQCFLQVFDNTTYQVKEVISLQTAKKINTSYWVLNIITCFSESLENITFFFFSLLNQFMCWITWIDFLIRLPSLSEIKLFLVRIYYIYLFIAL